MEGEKKEIKLNTNDIAEDMVHTIAENLHEIDGSLYVMALEKTIDLKEIEKLGKEKMTQYYPGHVFHLDSNSPEDLGDGRWLVYYRGEKMKHTDNNV